MSTDKAPLPEAVREQTQKFWECVRPLLYPEERGFIAGKLDNLFSLIWEAAAQQERVRLDETLTAVLANLRHAYLQAVGGYIKNPVAFGRDLLGPQIVKLEKLQSVASHPPPTPEDR